MPRQFVYIYTRGGSYKIISNAQSGSGEPGTGISATYAGIHCILYDGLTVPGSLLHPTLLLIEHHGPKLLSAMTAFVLTCSERIQSYVYGSNDFLNIQRLFQAGHPHIGHSASAPSGPSSTPGIVSLS
jgi:hypothetical protein